MSKRHPLYATSRTAAELMDMKEREFLDLVQAGVLPRGRELAPGILRWAVDDLKRITAGAALEGGIDW